MLEKIPFLHRGNAYNIIVEEDLTFERVREILDQLLDMNVFDCDDDSLKQYTVDCGKSCYSVGVDGNNVMVLLK
jgi:hypothetical protein